jgi:MoxR-like ATPase
VAHPEAASPTPRGGGVAARAAAVIGNVERVIRGKHDVIRLSLVCILARGHLLIEDVPGVGKTSLAKALARSVGGTCRRIQFTPDLLPSDVTGVSVWNRVSGAFEFRPGGVFADIVLADEINRASPKTQSALLEAMEERQVTVDGTTRPLSDLFTVIATQNPVELEGTYPLPEAQLDRFLMRLEMGYPDPAAEADILAAHGHQQDLDALRPVTTPAELVSAARACRAVHTSEHLRAYVVALAGATRRHPDVLLGVSPRGALALQHAAQALAACAGREFLLPDDLQQAALPVLGHRIVLTTEAELAGRSPADVVAEVLRSVPVPPAGRHPTPG